MADNYTTYLYTPDLTMEANPLVSLFGLSWTSLIIEDVFAVIFFSFFACFPFVYYKRTVIPCKGFNDYVSKAFFNRPDKNKRYAWVFFGYLAAGISSRIYVLLEGVLHDNDCYPCVFCSLNKPHTYCNMIVLNMGNGQLIIPFVMITTVVVLSLLSGFFWLLKEYKINKKALDHLKIDSH